MENHPEELIEHYVYGCDSVDTLIRIRTLKSCRVRSNAMILVACRLVYHHATTLFRNGYEGFPNADDDALLWDTVKVDELAHPEDYKAVSSVDKTQRRAHRRQDDMILEIDFVDPQIGFKKGNILLVGRRSMRMRDRVSRDELDDISTFFLAQKAINPNLKEEFVNQSRWPLVP